MKKSIFYSLFLMLNGFVAMAQNVKYLHEWNSLLIELMVKDGFSPVLATRGFAYPNIAAYEAAAYFDNKLIPLQGKLNQYPAFQFETNKEDASVDAVLVQAVYKVAKQIMYREDACDSLYKKHWSELITTHGYQKILNSQLIGEVIGNHVITWMQQDRFNETKAQPLYLHEKELCSWQPTPPEYRAALEPYWKMLRPMVVKDLQKLSEPLPFKCDTAKNAKLHQLALEVYTLSKNLSAEQKTIAEFWDDNPDLNDKYKGHIGIPRRHINPASHWINIVRQVTVVQKASFKKTVQCYTLLSIAEYDAKIVSWNDKYTYNLIRPVTYIRRYIDDKWMPHLVTPPFPEHTSGHSVCSMASAEVLSCLLGDNIAFTDSTQLKYLNLPPRKFTSFKQAAMEVSESRILGGIHYRSGIETGIKQGTIIGRNVCDLLNAKDE
jgi:hypothetical protein